MTKEKWAIVLDDFGNVMRENSKRLCNWRNKSIKTIPADTILSMSLKFIGFNEPIGPYAGTGMFVFEDDKGRRYPMFPKEFSDLLNKVHLGKDNDVLGEWGFRSRSEIVTIYLIAEL